MRDHSLMPHSKQQKGKLNRRPRCSRDKAHNRFLASIKIKRLKLDEIREAKRFQLNEIRRKLSRCFTQTSGASRGAGDPFEGGSGFRPRLSRQALRFF